MVAVPATASATTTSLPATAAITAVATPTASHTPSPTAVPTATATATVVPAAVNRRVPMEEQQLSFMLPFDAIQPIYEPQLATAEEAPLQDDELVLGVSWGGEARAYPVSVLRFREIVIDEVAGIPILVSW